MATGSKRDVELNIGVGVTGEEKIDALRRDVAELSKTTKEAQTVEVAARAETAAARTVLVEKQEALSRLRIETDKSARSETEFLQAERAAKTAISDARLEVAQKAEAVTRAAASTKAAAAAERALQNDLTSAAAAYRQTGASAIAAGDAQAQGAKKAATGIAELKGQLDGLQNVVALAFGGSLVGSLAKDVGETADAFNGLQSRIKLVTGEGAAFNVAFTSLLGIAQRTGTAVEDVSSLFTKLAQAGKQLNLGNADVLRLVESITQATQISGASAESSTAAIVQFSQAIASGVLRGDELNSILEQAPRLARALAEGLGVTTGELRKLGEAGSLTATQVIGALQGQSATLQKEFDQLAPTIGRAITSLSNNWLVYVGEVDKATGASATAAKAILALGNNLDTIGALLYSAGKAAAAYAAVNLAKSFLASAAAAATSAAAKAAETAATQANTTATVANSAAKGANASASTASALAGAEAAASMGRFSSLISTIKIVSLVGVLTNLREIGTAIGEGAAKLMGYGKSIEAMEIAQRADEQASRANAAAKAELAQKLQLTTEKALGLTDQSRKLIAEFTDTVTKGGEVSVALDKVTKALELGNLDGIRNAGTALDVLGQKGKLTGAQIRDAFADALKNEDLNVFRINALAAFDQTEQGARRLAAAIDAIAIESLRRVGTSLDELTTGFSKASTSAINDVDALADTLSRLKLKGDDASRAMNAALDKALAAATTERAVKAVIERFEQLGKQGLIAGDQMTEGLEKARTKLDELKPGINSLAEAFKTFGLQTRAEATAVATKYGEAYTEIKNSGTASLSDLRKAFDQWATAAIAANNGVEPYVVKVQRAILETAEAANTAGTAAEEAGNKTKKAFKDAKEQIDAAAGSLDALTAAANRNATVKSVLGTNKYDASGNALDSSGNLLQLTGQAKVGPGQFFDKAAYDRDAARATTVLDPQRYVKTDPGAATAGSAAAIQAGEIARLGGTAGGNYGAAGYSPFAPKSTPAPASGPTATPSSVSSSHTVEIKLQGTAFEKYQSTLVNMATQADAASLVRMLKTLDDAARSSGGVF